MDLSEKMSEKGKPCEPDGQPLFPRHLGLPGAWGNLLLTRAAPPPYHYPLWF